MRKTLSLLSAAAAFAAWATSVLAAAENAPRLKAEATVASDVVRIGDIVDNAGALADIPIFRAPDVGETGTVAVVRVIEALRPHGLAEVARGGVAEIAVTHLGRLVSAREIESAIADAFSGRYGFGEAKDLSLSFDRPPHGFGVDASAGAPKVVRTLYDGASRRFDVGIELADGATTRRLRYTGTLVETVEIPVLARPANRGDVIKAADVVIERKPKVEVAAGMVRDLDKIVGLAVRSPMRAGQPLRTTDLMKPEIVRQNEAVTLLFEAPGMILSARGKALESGAEGDTVSVVNPQSKQTVQGVVTGPNRVTVVSAAPRILALEDGSAARLTKTAAR